MIPILAGCLGVTFAASGESVMVLVGENGTELATELEKTLKYEHVTRVKRGQRSRCGLRRRTQKKNQWGKYRVGALLTDANS
jgi:hypothetical protein